MREHEGEIRNRMVWLGIAAKSGILLGLILIPLRAVFGLTRPRFAERGCCRRFRPW